MPKTNPILKSTHFALLLLYNPLIRAHTHTKKELTNKVDENCHHSGKREVISKYAMAGRKLALGRSR